MHTIRRDWHSGRFNHQVEITEMGLLDDQDFDMQGYGGLLGGLLYRGTPPSESGLAEQGRAAAATRLASGIRNNNRTYAGGVFQTGSAPFGFAGPGSLNFGAATSTPDLSAFEPAREPEEQGPMPDDAMMAQLARNNAAARLARGVKSVSRTNASPDFVDVGKSLGVGVANGGINLLGLPANAITGFGFLPDNFAADAVRRHVTDPEMWTPEGIRKQIESKFDYEFYEPKTRMGRYAETIGEFVPSLAGSGLSAIPGAVRGAAGLVQGTTTASELAPAAAAVMDKLGRKAVTDVVIPGVITEAIKEAAPDTKLDSVFKNGYKAVRSGLPWAIATHRYFGS